MGWFRSRKQSARVPTPDESQMEIRDFLLQYVNRSFYDLKDGPDYENYRILESMGLLHLDRDANIVTTDTGHGIITGRIKTRSGTPGYLLRLLGSGIGMCSSETGLNRSLTTSFRKSASPGES